MSYGAWGPGAYGCPDCGGGCFGDAAAPAGTTSDDSYETYLKTGLSLFAQYKAETSDPRREAALMQAQIQNLEALKAKTPALASVYDLQINRAKAKLAAAQQQLALRAESEAATRQWRGLGQAGAGIGIVLGIALVGLVGAATLRVAKRS